MNYIEQVFRNKAKDEGCSILVSKWNYDSTLIPEALETIPLIFPHFSKHNKSHSETILNNIVNVLGKNVIEQLSSTDLWLILESAYCHDLGMVITVEMINAALQDGSFLKYFRSVLADPFHEMYKYAAFYAIKDGKLVLKQNEFSLMMYDSVRFLMSDYFRSRHADNSLKAIANTDSVLALDLPKAIVPTRLISMMGAVCRSHTLNFNEVMSLPQVENGIATDMAHPRFVACLLRLGDILDIDNNRFSDVFMKTISEMPELSQLHKDKHLSITHLRIDSKYIEVNAKCKSPRVAKVTKDWFSWIKEEVNNQTLRWNTIVPDDISCYLPTISHLDIEIEGYDNLSTIEMPRFTIDVNKALELLQGKNFYKDPFDSIRELLQNAVDSTLLKLYELYKDSEVIRNGIDNSFLNVAKQFPIYVKVRRDAKGIIQVSISDKGLGISKRQLKFLSNTGSSSKNVLKQDIIRNMPVWMRPSGVFGIGFQSIFLLTDRVDIETKDFFTDECISIEMYNPRSKMKGDIYIKPCSHMYDSGFKISFSLREECNRQKRESNDFFDEIHEEDSVVSICEKVKQYAEMSFFPIYCNTEYIERESNLFFDQETGIELKFADTNGILEQKFYFKNALVEPLPNVPFFSMIANFHSCDSVDYLTLDRSAFKDRMKSEAQVLLYQAIDNYLHSLSFVPVYNKGINSFVLFMRLIGNSCIPVLEKDWDYEFKGKPMHEYLNYHKVKVTTTFAQFYDIKIVEEGNDLHLIVDVLSLSSSEESFRVLFKILSDHFKNCYLKRMFAENRFRCVEYVMQDEEESDEDIDNNILSFVWDVLKKNNNVVMLPYLKGYRNLRIPADKAMDLPVDSSIAPMLPRNKMVKMISPFRYDGNKLIDKRCKQLYDFVHECNGSSIDDIKADYERFVQLIISIWNNKERIDACSLI